jgi:hypothetical protein
MAGDPRQCAFGRNARLDALVFFARFGACLGDDSLQAIDQFDRPGLAIELRRHARVQIVGILLHAVDIRMHRENRLGVLGGKVPPLIG